MVVSANVGIQHVVMAQALAGSAGTLGACFLQCPPMVLAHHCFGRAQGRLWAAWPRTWECMSDAQRGTCTISGSEGCTCVCPLGRWTLGGTRRLRCAKGAARAHFLQLYTPLHVRLTAWRFPASAPACRLIQRTVIKPATLHLRFVLPLALRYMQGL